MKILIICPAPARSRKGNRVTAVRWARLLRRLGHTVSIRQKYQGERCDGLIALHARRSANSIHAFARQRADRPLIVALTGTDLYRDIRTSRRAKKSLDVASRLIVLQPNGVNELADGLRAKVRVVLQSAERTKLVRRRAKKARFQVCLLGHLRHEKDPLRAAMAARQLPADSTISIVHAGAALDPTSGRRAQAESNRNSRYRWIGEVSNRRARRILAASQLMLLTSRLEGGANVLSEAIVDSVPIVASDIPSTRGILGDSYPGLYPVGNTKELARLLVRAETDRTFYKNLQDTCRRLRPKFSPQAETARWQAILAECLSG